MQKFLTFLIFITSLYAHSYSLKDGWQMLGAVEDIKDISIFNDNCVNSVWRYDNINSSWQRYISNNEEKNTLESLNKAVGFWVKADGNCTLNETNFKIVSFKEIDLTKKYFSELILDKRFQIVRDSKTFDDIYQNYIKPIGIEKDMFSVDFEKETLLMLFMGLYSSTGYSLTVKYIKEYNNYMEVEIENYMPSYNCAVGTLMTSPIAFVTIPKTDKEIIFKEYANVRVCEDIKLALKKEK